jgi:hypothetical protein
VSHRRLIYFVRVRHKEPQSRSYSSTDLHKPPGPPCRGAFRQVIGIGHSEWAIHVRDLMDLGYILEGRSCEIHYDSYLVNYVITIIEE